VPGPGTLRASGLAGSPFVDRQVTTGVTYYYVVRSVDGANGSEDDNVAEVSATPTGPLADGVWASGGEIGDPLFDASTGSAFGDPTRTTAGAAHAGGAITANATEHVGWHVISDGNSHTGDRHFYSTYSDGQCSTLESEPIALTVGQSSQMSFWTKYGIESGYDGGVLEISTNGGTSWSTLTPTGGYPGSFTHSGNACGYSIGHGAYTDNLGSWTPQSVDLSAYNGQTVRLRWVFSTDSGTTADGWHVDDVAITHAQVPGACTGVIFADGFESGTTGAWSAAVP
jgi:Immune inhibitor A-like, MAM domain/Reelin subrepeat B